MAWNQIKAEKVYLSVEIVDRNSDFIHKTADSIVYLSIEIVDRNQCAGRHDYFGNGLSQRRDSGLKSYFLDILHKQKLVYLSVEIVDWNNRTQTLLARQSSLSQRRDSGLKFSTSSDESHQILVYLSIEIVSKGTTFHTKIGHWKEGIFPCQFFEMPCFMAMSLT